MSRTSAVSKKSQAQASPFEEIQRLYSAISERVIGQDEAKRVISMAVALHLDRIQNNSNAAKSNILLHGPTGSGKTEIARAIAGAIKCPFAIVDCTKLTPSGFIGSDPTAFLLDLYHESGDDLEATERSIIFLDEIDKLCITNCSHEGAFQARKVMAELLKIIEGQKIQFKQKSVLPGLENTITIDTTNILFVAAGAFAGIEEHFAQAKAGKQIGLGSSSEVSDFGAPKKPTQADFVKALFNYGMMPELAGRFQLMAATTRLSKEDYKVIISSTGFSQTANYYGQLLARENSTLELSAPLIEHLADQAVDLGLGARGIQGLIESRMVELMFDIALIRGRKVTLELDGYTVEGAEVVKKKATNFAALFKKNSILSGLDSESITEFCAAGKIKDYEQGAVLMNEGDEASCVMILMHGALRASNRSGLNVLRSDVGSCFGEISFLDGNPRTATVRAENPSKVLELNSKELSALINKRPDLGVKVLQAFSRVAFERVKSDGATA
jgi:ATP-dependent Clp protease ATP-binding subunit ClpX